MAHSLSEAVKKSIKSRLKTLLKSHFVMGIIIIIPLWLTFFVASILFNWIGNFTFPTISSFTSDKQWVYIITKISSFFISIAFICFLGFLANRVLGKTLLKFFEQLLGK
ncbi:MAG: hypothetical protein LBT79_03695, partial [Elusimicrobiota bacterium]|nr:hypothetical protein [Elusimicrobiota bacterium]